MNKENNPQDDNPYVYDDDVKDKKYRRTQIAGFSVIAAVIIGTAAGTGALASVTPEPIKNLLNISNDKPKVFESLNVDATAPSGDLATAEMFTTETSLDADSSMGDISAQPSLGDKGKHILVPPVFIGGDDDDDDYEDEDESIEHEDEEESEED